MSYSRIGQRSFLIVKGGQEKRRLGVSFQFFSLYPHCWCFWSRKIDWGCYCMIHTQRSGGKVLFWVPGGTNIPLVNTWPHTDATETAAKRPVTNRSPQWATIIYLSNCYHRWCSSIYLGKLTRRERKSLQTYEPRLKCRPRRSSQNLRKRLNYLSPLKDNLQFGTSQKLRGF